MTESQYWDFYYWQFVICAPFFLVGVIACIAWHILEYRYEDTEDKSHVTKLDL